MEESQRPIPAREVERMMKLQALILKAMAGQLLWIEAAEIAGMSGGPQVKTPDPPAARRERRPLPDMLLHIHGSKHRWFQDDRYYDLTVVLDDATNETYCVQLVEEESTRTAMAVTFPRAVKQVEGGRKVEEVAREVGVSKHTIYA